MVDYNWPMMLPSAPLLEGNNRSPLSNRSVFNPDEGPPIAFQKSTFQMFSMSWNFHFTLTQRDEFIRFYQDDLRSGSRTFRAVDPYSGEAAELYFENEPSIVRLTEDLYQMSSTVRRVS